MAVLVGIDEAGYGPLLGPLVVSSVVFSVPDDLLSSDMWLLLNKAVAKQKKHLAGRLLITDSKKAYSKSSGIGHLRKTVLSALLACPQPPSDLALASDLASHLHSDHRLDNYLWYKDLPAHSLGADEDDIALAAAVLKNCLSENNMQLLNITTRCLDVGYYNKMVSAVKNKANVLFTAVCELITSVLKSTYASDNLQIIVDRQGGRLNYRTPLSRMFPRMDITIIRQDNSLCSYELATDSKKIRIHFAAKADLKYLPVSLASMTSKYLREVLVDSINRYFISQ